MKKIVIILLLTSSFFNVNCSNDDDSGNCFDCRNGDALIQFCRDGDNYRVTNIGTGITQEYPLGDQTWEDLRAEIEATCE